MEKINLAEILKDCPTGMELDCTMFEGIEFDSIVNNDCFPIRCRIKNSNGEYYFYSFTKRGYWNNDYKAKCVIFPKGKTTWEGFVPPCKPCEFKDGDIIYNRLQKKICICYLCRDEVPRIKGCRYNESNMLLQFEKLEYPIPIAIQDYRLATEEEKEKLFKAIKDNGYKWNPETKTLEKLPKFKVGDKIQNKDNGKQFTITKVYQDRYDCSDDRYVLTFVKQDNWELVPNKFDISTLVPFESRVLVRDNDYDEWRGAFWGHLRQKADIKYDTLRGVYRQCIPYNDDTKHLLGKTNSCDDYYKTWEK